MKQVFLPNIVACVVIEAKDGSKLAHCIVDDDCPDNISVITDWKELPSKFKKDGQPLHEYLGLDVTKVGAVTVVDFPADPEPGPEPP